MTNPLPTSSEEAKRVSFVHYMHELWPEDFILSPVTDVLHVKHEASGETRTNAMVVTRERDPDSLSTAGESDLGPDEERRKDMLTRASYITPTLQLERFLLLSLRDTLLAQLPASANGKDAALLAHIQEDEDLLSRIQEALTDTDPFGTYEALVYKPAITSSPKPFFPIQRWRDPLFLEFYDLYQRAFERLAGRETEKGKDACKEEQKLSKLQSDG